MREKDRVTLNSGNKVEEDGDDLCQDDKDSADEAIGQDSEGMNEDDVTGEGEKTNEIFKNFEDLHIFSCV